MTKLVSFLYGGGVGIDNGGNRRALVVGLGISGISTAVRLRQIGWTPVLIERAPARRRGGYFVALFKGGRSAAKRLGILESDRVPVGSANYEIDRAGNRRPGLSPTRRGKETNMTALAEHDSGTAARILAAARELVLKRGVTGLTIAEIAQRAHVGKGTAYLYWGTKEDLLLGLLARDFLASAEHEIDALITDPDLARPHRLCPRLIDKALDYPFVRALQIGDADLLGVLARHPRSTELLDTLGPATLMETTLPAWRSHRLARTDWPLDEQTYALHALITGFLDAATSRPPPHVTVSSPAKVMAAAVTALLGPERASPADVRATARQGIQLLRQRRKAVLALMTEHTPSGNHARTKKYGRTGGISGSRQITEEM